jgi:hypothetical protein
MKVYCSEHRKPIQVNRKRTGTEHTTTKDTCDSWSVVIVSPECENRWSTNYYLKEVNKLWDQYFDLANLTTGLDI